MTVPEPLVSNTVAASRPGGKSIQAYIDEQPVWADGTAVDMTPMTAMQWRILILAAAGKFFEGFVVFLTGVALPLMVEEFDMGATQHGLISAATLFGILIGALLLGGLADRFGRKPMFIAEMIIFVVFLCLLVATPVGRIPWLSWYSICLGLAWRLAAIIRPRTSLSRRAFRPATVGGWS